MKTKATHRVEIPWDEFCAFVRAKACAPKTAAVTIGMNNVAPEDPVAIIVTWVSEKEHHLNPPVMRGRVPEA